MRKGLVTINGQSLPVREFKGQRVVTIQDVAEVHKSAIKTIRNNFQNNNKHFVEGVDYYHVKGKGLTQKLGIASKNITQINVFTESGYLMLSKSLTDDLSWQVQRELVNSYFKVKELTPRPATQSTPLEEGNATMYTPAMYLVPLLEEDYRKLLYYRLEKRLSQEETGKILGISATKICKMEHILKQAGFHIPKSEVNRKDKYQLKHCKEFVQLTFSL